MELGPSGISGVGVFAVKQIKKGQRVAEGLSRDDFKRLISWRELPRFDSQTRKKIRDFCIGTPEGFVPPEGLDFDKLSVEWYFNHSCIGNVGFDKAGDFIALRNIRGSEEMTYDYGLAESNPKFKMRCRCGSLRCRGIVTGNDWKKPQFRKGRVNKMLPRLRKIG